MEKNVVMIVDDCATDGYCKNEQMKKTFVLTLLFYSIEESWFSKFDLPTEKLNRDSTVTNYAIIINVLLTQQCTFCLTYRSLLEEDVEWVP